MGAHGRANLQIDSGWRKGYLTRARCLEGLART